MEPVVKIATFIEAHHPDSEKEYKLEYCGTYYLTCADEDAIEVRIVKKYTMKEINDWYDQATSNSKTKD